MGTNVTVFVLFFLLALIEALQSRNWPLVALFGVLGVLSLRADSLVHPKRNRRSQ
jgi:hypothetical protein